MDNDLSQNKLALSLRVYQQTIDKWERGVVVPSMETLIQLASYFDVTIDYLVGLNDDIMLNNDKRRKNLDAESEISAVIENNFGSANIKTDNSKKY